MIKDPQSNVNEAICFLTSLFAGDEWGWTSLFIPYYGKLLLAYSSET
jgi:hypothetical protein